LLGIPQSLGIPQLLGIGSRSFQLIIASLAILASAGVARAQSGGGFGSITVVPQRLSNGSPFLLTVKVAETVSSVEGSWTGRKLLFFRDKSVFREKPGLGGEIWRALAGVDVETAPGTYPLEIEATTGDGKRLKTLMQIPVAAANYRSGRLSVAENFVVPDAATQTEIAADKELKDRVFAKSAPEPEWSGEFLKPVNAAATDSFGTRRTFNGKLASIHRGMDFRAPPGTPVGAANSGTVILARKLFYEGNCVVIDHGQGFMTIYMHLSRLDLAEGARVRKGERLGLSGATGRVTGPHLHFAARWQGAYVDPAGLFALPLGGKP